MHICNSHNEINNYKEEEQDKDRKNKVIIL